MAQCEKCHGSSFVHGPSRLLTTLAWPATFVCPECQGSGIVSCCDTAGASAIVVGATYSLDGISFKVIAKGPSESADAVKRWSDK